MDFVSLFLRAAIERPFDFATQNDCLMWLADYVHERRGADPAADLRGRYRTALGARRIIKRTGGMAALVEACVAPLGIARTLTPARGDIAVVNAPEGETGAIVTGGLMACFGDRRVLIRPLAFIVAWRV